jgi:rhodanese-related sulfurtransferase
MPRLPGSTALRMLLLAGLAALAALISNRLASPSRRLAWRGPAVPQVPLAAPPGRALPPETGAPARDPGPSGAAPANGLRPPLARPEATHPTPPPRPAEAAGPIREIDGAEAWGAFQAGVPFLDARRRAEFAEGHIPGAWCAPVWEADLDERLLSFKAARRPGPEDPIVLYCSGGDCRDSHLLAAKLLNEGYFHLLVYRDGFPDWSAQGRPVEKGQP